MEKWTDIQFISSYKFGYSAFVCFQVEMDKNWKKNWNSKDASVKTNCLKKKIKAALEYISSVKEFPTINSVFRKFSLSPVCYSCRNVPVCLVSRDQSPLVLHFVSESSKRFYINRLENTSVYLINQHANDTRRVVVCQSHNAFRKSNESIHCHLHNAFSLKLVTNKLVCFQGNVALRFERFVPETKFERKGDRWHRNGRWFWYH